MLNKALMLASGGKKKGPMFTIDLTDLAPEYIGNFWFMTKDGTSVSLVAGEAVSLPYSLLDLDSVPTGMSGELQIGFMEISDDISPSISVENAGYWTERGASFNWSSTCYYIGPIDVTKSSYIKFAYQDQGDHSGGGAN